VQSARDRWLGRGLGRRVYAHWNGIANRVHMNNVQVLCGKHKTAMFTEAFDRAKNDRFTLKDEAKRWHLLGTP